MARIKINLPEHYHFQTTIPIRITDLNYGGHVGNDRILSIIHEARVQFLQHFGYSELNVEGIGLIMSDVGIEYKAELFYPDSILVRVAVAELSRVGFDLYYRLEKTMDEKSIVVATAKTGMLFFNYDSKKVGAIPEAFKIKFQNN